MALPSQASKAKRVLVIAWSVMLTAPVISGLDRGNIQILTVSLMMLGCALLAKGKPLTAAVVIGLAGSLKLYPILLVGLFFRRGMLRYAIVSCASALLVSASTLAMFQGGLVQNIMEMKGNLASSQAELARLYLAFNSSIMGLVHSVNSLQKFGDPFVDFSAILTIVAMVLLALTIFFSRNSHSYCYITSAVTSFMILILEYSPAYALGVLLCATFWIFAEAPMSHGDHIIRAALAGTISLILVPKQIPTPLGTVFDSSGATLSSLLNPILLLVIMGTSLIGAITSRRPS